jgi:hypothetical protein
MDTEGANKQIEQTRLARSSSPGRVILIFNQQSSILGGDQSPNFVGGSVEFGSRENFSGEKLGFFLTTGVTNLGRWGRLPSGIAVRIYFSFRNFYQSTEIGAISALVKGWKQHKIMYLPLVQC